MYPIEGECTVPMDRHQSQWVVREPWRSHLGLGRVMRCQAEGQNALLPLRGQGLEVVSRDSLETLRGRAHPDLNQGPADLQSAALPTELCTQLNVGTYRL